MAAGLRTAASRDQTLPLMAVADTSPLGHRAGLPPPALSVQPSPGRELNVPTKWRAFAVILAVAASSPAFGKKPPTRPLKCGKVPNVESEAERQYLDKASGGGDIYQIFLTYIGKKPTNKQLDAALRDCLAVGIKMDGSKDILATAWYRRKRNGNPNDDDQLHPYNGMKYIAYTASTKTIEIHSLSK